MRRASTRSWSCRGRSCSASASSTGCRTRPGTRGWCSPPCCSVCSASGFTITILSVSIPRIADDLGSDESTLTWLVTGPILAFAVFGPTAGKLGDLRGHRRVYAWSMACVILFAGLTALSWNAPSLLAFRILGAATGAAVGPTSLAVINRMFPPAKRAQAMGYWTMVGAGGPVIGVVAGGPIVEAFGWRWIFVGQVPMTAAGLLLALAVLPETEKIATVAVRRQGRRVAWPWPRRRSCSP